MNHLNKLQDEKDRKILFLEQQVKELKSLLDKCEDRRLQCQDESLEWRMKHEDLETAYYKLKYGRASTS